MNERTKLLAEQAGMGYHNLSTGNGDNWQFTGTPAQLEQFAESIVQEVMQLTQEEENRYYDMNEDLFALSIENFREIVKEHFGVKE
jgi:hypothetical protein